MRALLLAVVLLASPGAAAGGSVEAAAVSCGNVSPLGNSCVAGDIIVSPGLNVSMVVLGYTGKLSAELRQVIVIDERPYVFTWTRTCSVVGSAALMSCAETGWVVPWFRATLTCRATALTAAPPLGPWSCEARN